jgi:hypothetical protein
MKKILLFILVFGVGFSLMAQNTYKFKKEPKHATIYQKMAVDKEPLKPSALTKAKVNPQQLAAQEGDRNTDIVTIIDIGTSANAWCYNSNNTGNQKSLVWAEPGLNIVTNFHRDGGTLNPSAFSGDYAYDISMDGGMTWTNQIKCYTAVNNNGGSDGDAARYPNHGIYNPTGNVEDAYVSFFGPNLDGSNSDTPGAGWGGYSYGVNKISSPDDTTGSYNTHTSQDGIFQYIPDAYDINSQGVAYLIDKNIDWTSGTGVYQGSIIVDKGTFDSEQGDFVYEESLFDYDSPLTFGSPWFTQVAFGPDGMTGYIAILGNNGETWNTGDFRNSIYPIFWKTTDGGETWDGPTAIQIDGPDGIDGIVNNLLTDDQIASIYLDPVPARDEIPYTYLGDFEIAVDNNNNLHIGGVVAAAGDAGDDTGISFYVQDSLGAVLDLFTDDGGTTWYVEEMGRTIWYSGSWGSGDNVMAEGNRVQMSTSPEGDVIFISWLDTDKPEAVDNSSPNIWCRGFMPSTYMKTANGSGQDAPTCVTLFSAGMWQALFGTVSKTALESDGVYTLPYVYVQLTDNDPSSPAQFKYIQDFHVSMSDFTIVGTGGEIAAPADNIVVSQNYPNPFSDVSNIKVNLNRGSNLSLEVFTITGQQVLSQDYGFASAGAKTLTVNANNFVPGVYFYTVTAGDSKVTHKMVVE